MVHKQSSSETVCNPNHAQWTINVLGLMISVVGKKTLLGLILQQTRAEIASLIRTEAPEEAPSPSFSNN